eukprot:Lithocolla_globosa_v1_NODE_12241_length_448_cov_96.590331.p1 type:complete len:100 gc:universal NODE_12241_length_448_cov_96.590331:142-441(+)
MSKCPRCSKTVYPVEEQKLDGTSYHKGCFRCLECNQALSTNNLAKFEGEIYCTQHLPKLAPKSTGLDSAQTAHALSTPLVGDTVGGGKRDISTVSQIVK